MVFATEGFFKVAIESYTESDLSTGSLYSVLTDVLTDWANRLWVQVELRTNFVQLPQFHLLFSSRFLLGYCQNVLLSLKFCTANHMNICEYIDTCIDIDTDVYIYIYIYIYITGKMNNWISIVFTRFIVATKSCSQGQNVWQKIKTKQIKMLQQKVIKLWKHFKV